MNEWNIYSCCRGEHRFDEFCILSRETALEEDRPMTKCENPACDRKVPVVPNSRLHCCLECKNADIEDVVIERHSNACSARNYNRQRNEALDEKSLQEKQATT